MAIFETKIREKLNARLHPTYLDVRNESPHHGLPADAEKHFRVVAVADAFKGLSRVDRHRLVHDAVDEELKAHVHALAVQAFTPEEWAAKGGETISSPECLGGGKREGIR